MSSMSGGGRVAAPKSSFLQQQSLHTRSTQQLLETLHELFTSSYGPRASITLVHNNLGGHVIASTSADRILQSISLSQPLSKLIITTIKAHIQKYSDGGTFLALLSLKLILSSLNLGVPLKLVIEVHDWLLKICIQLLSDCVVHDDDSCVECLDLSNTDQIIILLKSIIGSNPACFVYDADLFHICQLLMQAFAFQNYSANAQGIHYICVSGCSVIESELLPGLLYEAPHLPSHSIVNLDLPCIQNGACRGQIKVALVRCSLAGDSDEFLDINYETTYSTKLPNIVLQQINKFVEKLIGNGITVLACQKVVHPTLKQELKESGILVIDRLGEVCFKKVVELAGGVAISSLLSDFVTSNCGHLQSISHCIIGEKRWLHLQGMAGKSSVCTLLLKHFSEQAVEELKTQCKTAMHILQMSLSEPRMLCGGGCWISWLAHHVQTQVASQEASLVQELGCSATHLRLIVTNFTRCLKALFSSAAHHVEMPAMRYHHLLNIVEESSHCQCGRYMVQANNDVYQTPAKVMVMDSYLVYVNALGTAVGLAGMILSIDNIVQDIN